MTITEYILACQLGLTNTEGTHYGHIPRVVCKDGFSISVQASGSHYSSPKEFLSINGWTKVELGYPSEPIPELAEHADGQDPDATEGIWAYTPIEAVEKLLDSHSGIDLVATIKDSLKRNAGY